MSPILGIYASQISGHLTPADTGAMFPLGMVQVGSGGASSIDFTSIPATYKHLQIRGIVRMSGSGAANCIGRFNSDSTSNYNSHYLGGNGASVSAGYFTNGSYTGFYSFDGAGNSSGSYVGFVLDILDYANTSKYKTTRVLSGFDVNGNGGNITFNSGLWRSTTAISSISFLDPSASNFAEYSQFALYGIKGA